MLANKKEQWPWQQMSDSEVYERKRKVELHDVEVKRRGNASSHAQSTSKQQDLKFFWLIDHYYYAYSMAAMMKNGCHVLGAYVVTAKNVMYEYDRCYIKFLTIVSASGSSESLRVVVLGRLRLITLKLLLVNTLRQPSTDPASTFKSMLDAALAEYKKKTGEDLQTLWLASELQTCESVDSVLDLLQDQAKAFEQSGDQKLMKWIDPLVHVLLTFSDDFGDGLSLVTITNPIHDDSKCSLLVQRGANDGWRVRLWTTSGTFQLRPTLREAAFIVLRRGSGARGVTVYLRDRKVRVTVRMCVPDGDGVDSPTVENKSLAFEPPGASYRPIENRNCKVAKAIYSTSRK
ncbi:hypothetical protein EI94DRAFT_1709865 [Lactarius quietus]|nr:hypothetical protein EI94DRAFT_1709865 [Lactarius quietus]